jgi:hypothetical protein
MGATTHIAYWREQLTDPDPPTDDAVIEQVVYNAITWLIEERWDELAGCLGGDGDYDRLANDWVDTLFSREPQEPNGFGRLDRDEALA